MTIHQNMFNNPREIKMRGILQPYTAKNLTTPANLNLMNKVAQIWDEHVGTDYLKRDNVILESVGGWLSQESWEDRTGYHIKIRMHPTYAHSATVQGRARAVIDAFIELFPNCKVEFTENLEILDVGDVNWQEKEKLGLTKTITVVVQTDRYSIGD
jgi:hypothetical protein